MLKEEPNQGLLENSNKNQLNRSSLKDKAPPLNDDVKPEDDKRQSKIQSKKKKRSEVTIVLKALSIIVGLSYIGFTFFFYSNSNQEQNSQNRGLMLRVLMPAYIGISGLIIILIECRIGFIVRNLQFLYNYFGRGLFNLYAGGMPLMFINDWTGNMTALDIVSIVAASVMCLVGLLYIGLKCCCCEMEGQKIDKLNKKTEQEQDD